ncbi:hypothetical protein [uncultured Clostridium sp.]|jgi:ribosomal protein L19|uniref:YfjL-like protein n=1 Tax=uncultured Clostridium sp. TaxID=59620 RepID=UPI00261889D8|nr:hypothetical protein [uncultured Clostridium sp.]
MFTKLKNLTKKKKILLSLLILLVTGLLLINNAINGNPISKALFKNKVQNYIDATYPHTDFTINSTFYNFKDANYSCNVTSKSGGLDFTIKQYPTGYFYDEYKESDNGKSIIDQDLSGSFMHAITDEFKAVINNDKFKIYNSQLIFQGKYKDRNTKYDRSFDDEFALNLSTNYDETYTTDEIVEVMVTLKNYLAKNKHNGFKGMCINFDENGIGKSILITDKQLNLSDEKVVDLIQDISISGEFDFETRKVLFKTLEK